MINRTTAAGKNHQNQSSIPSTSKAFIYACTYKANPACRSTGISCCFVFSWFSLKRNPAPLAVGPTRLRVVVRDVVAVLSTDFPLFDGLLFDDVP